MKEELKKNKDRMRMHYRGMNGRLLLLTDTKISIGQHFVNFVNISMRRKTKKQKLLKMASLQRTISVRNKSVHSYLF